MSNPAVADECIHGLTLPFCSICKQNVSAARSARAWGDAITTDRWLKIESPWTWAKYDGVCGNKDCEDEIEVGELIGLRDGNWMCNECAAYFDECYRTATDPSLGYTPDLSDSIDNHPSGS